MNIIENILKRRTGMKLISEVWEHTLKHIMLKQRQQYTNKVLEK